MRQRRSFFYSPTQPFTPTELERAWEVHCDGWLFRAANSRTQKDAFALLDQLGAYTDGGGFSMLPHIEKGFGMDKAAAMDLLTNWEIDRQQEN